MGGYGSGRWGYHTKKDAVEDCRWIDAGRFRREDMIRRGQTWRGLWEWRDQEGNKTSSVSLAITERLMTLQYTIHWRNHDDEEVRYEVPIVWTPCHFGGQRPWFICPGSRCGGRRVSKLYLPPDAKYFLCRHCHQLSYRSRQEWDSRAAWLSNHPELLDAIFSTDNLDSRDLLLGLKSLGHLARRL